MGNNGLLTILARAGQARIRREAAIADDRFAWRWRGVAVVRPEFDCPYCRTHLKANAIFVVSRDMPRLYGQLVVIGSNMGTAYPPHHPHGDGPLCMGNAHTAAELVSSPPYRDGLAHNPWSWFRRYFNHHCKFER